MSTFFFLSHWLKTEALSQDKSLTITNEGNAAGETRRTFMFAIVGLASGFFLCTQCWQTERSTKISLGSVVVLFFFHISRPLTGLSS